MSEPFLGQLGVFSFSYAPKGWAQCNGQFLPIAQNQALFALLGTTYGGNGMTTFALPDLRGRVPLHFGQGLNLGERAGEEAHTLNINETPPHRHTLQATQTVGTEENPDGQLLADAVPLGPKAQFNAYAAPGAGALVPMHSTGLTNAGGSQPHNNMQPYLTLNFCIALQGIFPSQN